MADTCGTCRGTGWYENNAATHRCPDCNPKRGVPRHDPDFGCDCGGLGILIMTGNDPINVERCDTCQRYDSDEDAAAALDRILAKRTKKLKRRAKA